MKLEETIQQAFDLYPGLYRRREQVLNHLFCVIGNGYYWTDGELVLDIHCDEVEVRFPGWKPVLDKRGKAIQRKEDALRKALERLQIKISDRDNIIRTLRKGNRRIVWYPLVKGSSYICNYPQDIREDWLGGIKETKNLLRKAGIAVPRNCQGGR